MKKWLAALAAVTVLAGCTNEASSQHDMHQEDPSLEPVQVEVLTDETLQPGEEVELAARVTQEGEAVEDADEVKFEVWESGLREDGTMLEAELTEDGVYQAKHTFDKEGVYYMFAHTTARGMHVMPKTKFVVGDPDLSKVLEDDSSDSMDHGMDHK